MEFSLLLLLPQLAGEFASFFVEPTAAAAGRIIAAQQLEVMTWNCVKIFVNDLFGESDCFATASKPAKDESTEP